MYIHPVTGDGVSVGWNLVKTIRRRAEQEERRRELQSQHILDKEFARGFDAGRAWEKHYD
jgi:hypothetical protein